MKRIFTVLIAVALVSSCSDNNNTQGAAASADTVKNAATADALKSKLSAYIQSTKQNIGVAVISIGDTETVSVNGHDYYAMMSVCKFPQAITLLHLVDEGKLARTAAVHVTKDDFRQPTGSSLQKDHNKVPFDLTIPEAFSYSIGQSDNVTSNIIFAMEGGPVAVEAYIRSLGITEIAVGTDYWHLNAETLYKNKITPVAAVNLLGKFYAGKILSDSSRAILWTAMVNALSGKNRLPGQLPAGAVIGHKTGTSGRDSTNITAAFNDVGIMELPNGKHVAVAVFVAKTSLPDEENAKIISDIGKMVWDHFMSK